MVTNQKIETKKLYKFTIIIYNYTLEGLFND